MEPTLNEKAFKDFEEAKLDATRMQILKIFGISPSTTGSISYDQYNAIDKAMVAYAGYIKNNIESKLKSPEYKQYTGEKTENGNIKEAVEILQIIDNANILSENWPTLQAKVHKWVESALSTAPDDGWIPVEKEKPEKNKEVMLCVMNGHSYQSGKWNGIQFTVSEHDEKGEYPKALNLVTHWSYNVPKSPR